MDGFVRLRGRCEFLSKHESRADARPVEKLKRKKVERQCKYYSRGGLKKKRMILRRALDRSVPVTIV